MNSSNPVFTVVLAPWGGVGQPPLLLDELAGVAWRFDVTKLAVADRYDAKLS